MSLQPDDDAREMIEAMLDAVVEQAPEFNQDLRELVIERVGTEASVETIEGRAELPGTGNYARAFLDALDGYGMEHIADWYDGLTWDTTILCDKVSVVRFLGSIVPEVAKDDRDQVVVRFPDEEAAAEGSAAKEGTGLLDLSETDDTDAAEDVLDQVFEDERELQGSSFSCGVRVPSR